MTDVCLVLEGTYPYVSGGVSTWIHQLVSGMPTLRFSILYVSAYPNHRREYKYKVPSNVVEIEDCYLHDYSPSTQTSSRKRRVAAFERLVDVHDRLLAGRWEAFDDLLPDLRDPASALTFADLFESEESWDTLTTFYTRFGENASFLDFFWTWRSIYLPLFKTLRCPIPRARVYHSVSTGYAGILAATAKATMDCSMLLTEHGVYTHERLLEISQATWIYSPHRDRFRVQRELSFFKRFWLGFFHAMGCVAYRAADRIITLFEGNRTKQMLAGAPSAKISIIPNGIDLDAFRDIASAGERPPRQTVAFVGRVVPIKDVKTFLHAAKIILDAQAGVDFLVLGPTDEEPEYHSECKELAQTLGLESQVRFLGRVDMREHYPNIDVVVLTSLSEAQPYVLLEANAAGIPVVATDVGACREMLEGRLPEDRRLGASGLLTSVSRPEDTAAAVLRLLRDARLRASMAQAGRARTLRFYDQLDLISQYSNIYEQMMR